MAAKRMLVLAVAALALAGCSSAQKSTTSTPNTASPVMASTTAITSSTEPRPSGTLGMPIAIASTTSVPSSPSTTAGTSAEASGVENLTVTGTLTTQLIDAAAALNQLPPSDYTGLVSGETYYAYDRADMTYWAGAALVPSSASTRGQVSVQDDGSYLLFQQPTSKPWTAFDVGAVLPGQPCPVPIPAAVVATWSWSPSSCKPAGV